MNNNFIPYNNIGNGMNVGMMNNVPQFDPYQDKINRFNNLQQQQQVTQQTQQQNTNMNFVVVENIQKAKEQIVPYGFTMWMRDSSEPYQYIKSVDQVGTPTFKVLKVEDVTENLNNCVQQNSSSEQFVSLEQYNQLNETVKQLQSTVEYYSAMINQVMTPKDKEVIESEIKQTKRTSTAKKVGDNNG